MKYCYENAVPHSIFLGRMWPNPSDPEESYWLPSDSDKVMAYQILLGEMCPNCGTFEEDWVDDEGYPLDVQIYEPDTVKCEGCQRLHEMSDMIPSEKKHAVRTVLRKAKNVPGAGSQVRRNL